MVWRASRRSAPANPKPVFRAGPVALMGAPRTVKDRHLKLLFRQDGRTLPAIAWRAAERGEYLTANRGALELAYSIEAGEYQGVATTELTVADVRVPTGAVCVRWQRPARVATRRGRTRLRPGPGDVRARSEAAGCPRRAARAH